MIRVQAGLLILLAACTRDACQPAKPPPAAPDWKAAFQYQVKFDAAKHAVVAQVKVAPGFHAYTTGETTGRPMELSFAEDSELVPSVPISYPAGKQKQLSIGRSVIVEGEAEIVAPLKPREGEALTGKRARGRFHYQVCTDTSCDRPKSVEFDLPGS